MQLFSSDSMAAGYAQARPPLHGRILQGALGSTLYNVALDVGCGSGLSTKPLRSRAKNTIGIDPVEPMLVWAARTAPGAAFLAASAEVLPVRSHSIDLMTAAGSLNYADLILFFGEATRVLRDKGTLLVYDFAQGRSFDDSAALDEWYGEFCRNYPRPVKESRQELDESILAVYPTGLQVRSAQKFQMSVPMTAASYAAYMMTETNVAHAIAAGTPESDIRDWCGQSTAGVFNGSERNVVFHGYFVIFVHETTRT